MGREHTGEGFGTTVAFANGFIARVRNVDIEETGDRDEIDLSHGDVLIDDNEPSSIVKVGFARVQMLYDTSKKPPFGQPPEPCTISNPKGLRVVGKAWLRRPSIAVPYKGEMLQTCELRFNEIMPDIGPANP